MATDSVSFHYTIQNGKFKGTQKTATIQMSHPGVAPWQTAMHAMITAGNLGGSFVSLYLYARSVRGSGAAFREIGTRLTQLERPLPNVTRPLVDGEIELGTEIDLTTMAPVVPEAEATLVADGALEAAAASTIVPGVGWVVGASLLALGAVIAGGLTIYDIVNSGETPLVSVVFINGMPNSHFGFTAANWSEGMQLVAGDTKASMLSNKAISSMTEAGSLQYTWQTAGATPNGTATIEFASNNGAASTADLVWSINPETGEHDCTLTHKGGEDLLGALCYKQPVQHGGKTHYVLLYIIVPSELGARRADFTTDPSKPLVFDNMWVVDSGGLLFGTYNFNPGSEYIQLKSQFTVSPSRSYSLRDLVLPIGFNSGVNEAVINLCADAGGKPGASLERFNVPNMGPKEASLMTLTSVARPVLSAGQTYWITADMADKASSGIWSFSEFTPRPSSDAAPMRFTVGGDPIS